MVGVATKNVPFCYHVYTGIKGRNTMKRTLLFTTIASILTLSTAYASSVITSQTYVDAQDELKQDKIPEAGVNAENNGGGVSVVTYTEDGDGILGERFICDADTDENGNCNADDLVTRDTLTSQVSAVTDNLQTATVTRKTCTDWVANASHTDSNCLLWNLTEVSGYIDNSCSSAADCSWMDCVGGGFTECSSGRCVCSYI